MIGRVIYADFFGARAHQTHGCVAGSGPGEQSLEGRFLGQFIAFFPAESSGQLFKSSLRQFLHDFFNIIDPPKEYQHIAVRLVKLQNQVAISFASFFFLFLFSMRRIVFLASIRCLATGFALSSSSSWNTSPPARDVAHYAKFGEFVATLLFGSASSNTVRRRRSSRASTLSRWAITMPLFASH
jgi:hypothetical protein